MNTKMAGAASGNAAGLSGKYLVCGLGDESYAIPVLHVREIIRMVAITPIPKMPPHVKGVINLRGKIIPVADMKERFGLGAIAITDTTCIVVVEINGAPGAGRQVGLMVDRVDEVASIPESDIEETPEFGGAVDTRFLLGLAKLKGKVAALVAIKRIWGNEPAETAVPGTVKEPS